MENLENYCDNNVLWTCYTETPHHKVPKVGGHMRLGWSVICFIWSCVIEATGAFQLKSIKMAHQRNMVLYACLRMVGYWIWKLFKGESHPREEKQEKNQSLHTIKVKSYRGRNRTIRVICKYYLTYYTSQIFPIMIISLIFQFQIEINLFPDIFNLRRHLFPLISYVLNWKMIW